MHMISQYTIVDGLSFVPIIQIACKDENIF